MPSTQALDEDALDTLARMLDTRAVPFGGMNLEALDGFFSALAVGPEEVPSSEWGAEIWGPKPPNWESAGEAQEVMDLLMCHWNLVAERVRHAGDEMTERLLPLVWLPESDDDPDAGYIGHDWALGFLRGIDLRRPAWEQWFESEEDWIVKAYLDLVSLVLGRDVTQDAPDGEGEPEDGDLAGDSGDEAASSSSAEPSSTEEAAQASPLTVAERTEIVLDLPWLLYDLNVHRVEALTPRTPIRAAAVPGRNDPCSCGSGRKYKKCCGAG